MEIFPDIHSSAATAHEQSKSTDLTPITFTAQAPLDRHLHCIMKYSLQKHHCIGMCTVLYAAFTAHAAVHRHMHCTICNIHCTRNSASACALYYMQYLLDAQHCFGMCTALYAIFTAQLTHMYILSAAQVERYHAGTLSADTEYQARIYRPKFSTRNILTSNKVLILTENKTRWLIIGCKRIHHASFKTYTLNFEAVNISIMSPQIKI